jgi:hypothetical protein
VSAPLPRAPVLGEAALFAFANLPWDLVYLWVTQSRKVRLGPDKSSHDERDVRGLDVE